MEIIAVSDIHGDMAGIERLAPVLSEADLVLVLGDITNFGGRKEATAVLDRLERYSKRILAIPGNCDRPEVGALLSERGLSLDQRAVEVGGLWLAGLGGSLPCPGRTLLEYSEQELAQALKVLGDEISEGWPFILVCHQPPQGTKLDKVFGGLHVGSRAIREFIEKRKPLACFCGHIHEASGRDEIGGTIIVNPGPLHKGGYILCGWHETRLKVEIKRGREKIDGRG
jgi:Icc-related predicted phosphoesterase